MKIRRTILLSSLGLVLACGGGGGGTPDAGDPDSGVVCSAATSGEQALNQEAQGFISWFAPVTVDLGDGGEVIMVWEFYDGIRADLTGTWDLTDSIDGNYETCASCVRVFSLDAGGELARQFFQSAGTITLDASPFAAGRMSGSLNNVSLVEVTIDGQTFESTPIAGGMCLSLGASVALSADRAPAAWTCDSAAYGSGGDCDCACGAPDPDCQAADAPVTGCEEGQVCVADGTCATPPDNDTCAAAVAAALDTPIAGTSRGARSDYNLGLEPATCTGFSQAGPDVVYSIALTADQAITATLTGIATSFDPSLAIVGPGEPAVCDASPIVCLAGKDAAEEGAGETLSFTAPTTGTYYLLIDTFYRDAGGDFTLTITSP
jgi:hypothetical protein